MATGRIEEREQINFRCSSEQKAIIQSKAAAACLNLNAYLLRRAMGGGSMSTPLLDFVADLQRVHAHIKSAGCEQANTLILSLIERISAATAGETHDHD